MKAEQRKELETNTLADKMGHVMTRVKGSGRRTFVIYLLTTIALVVALFISYRWWVTEKEANSARWMNLYDASPNKLFELMKTDGTTYPGKAARFQVLWHLYWENGIKMIGMNPDGSMKTMQQVGDEYKKLAEECKDDPIFEPQAMLGRAVAKESLAPQDRSHLDGATELYDEVIKKYPDSAQGKFAKKRYDQLKDDKTRKEIRIFYEAMERKLQVPPVQAAPQLQMPGAKKDKLLP